MTEQQTTLELAMDDMQTAFRQLEFAIKLLSYCEGGQIKAGDFDTDHNIQLGAETIHLPSGHFSDPANIVHAASVGVLSAFSVSILVMNDVFVAADIPPDPQSSDDIVRLRTLVHMMRCAQAHGFANARWEARGPFHTVLTVGLDGTALVLDLAALHDQPFNVDQIGGYPNWYRLRDAVMKIFAS